MSLVEVLIAMGVSGVVLLGMTQMMSYTNKSIKSASMSNDWVNYMTNIRLAMIRGDGSVCAAFMTAQGFPVAPTVPRDDTQSLGQVAATAGAFTEITDLTINGIQYLRKNTDVNGFKATLMGFTLVPGEPPENLPFLKEPEFPGYNLPPYRRVRVRIEIAAEKQVIAGTVNATGGNSIGSLKKDALTLRVFYGSDGRIKSCFNPEERAAETCDMLGGVYDLTVGNKYKCKLRDVYYGTASADQGFPDGQKIQLWAQNPANSQGIKAASDYGIGISSNTMWFNAGESAVNGFNWTNNSGADPLMSIYGDTHPTASGLRLSTNARLNKGLTMGAPVMSGSPATVDGPATVTGNSSTIVSINGTVDLNGDVKVNGKPVSMGLNDCQWETGTSCASPRRIVTGGGMCPANTAMNSNVYANSGALWSVSCYDPATNTTSALAASSIRVFCCRNN